MFLSSILVSLFISLLTIGSWLGLLETLYCGHRADRLFFVGATTQQHEEKTRELQTQCSGDWSFNFGPTSTNSRHHLALELKDWELPRDQKPKR